MSAAAERIAYYLCWVGLVGVALELLLDLPLDDGRVTTLYSKDFLCSVMQMPARSLTR